MRRSLIAPSFFNQRLVVLVGSLALPAALLNFACSSEPELLAKGDGDEDEDGNGDGDGDGDGDGGLQIGGAGGQDSGPVGCNPSSEDCEETVAFCGDGLVNTNDENCDDGNDRSGDGCSDSCETEDGWACLIPGVRCQAAECGDGIIGGFEECDFESDETGCTDCSIDDGFDCDSDACWQTVCGDGKVERGEQCEDENDLPFDGCFECAQEPDCEGGVCEAACGDGERYADEPCDDGNRFDGDGCSSTCEVEAGFACVDVTGDPPDAIDLPVVFRDFIGVNRNTNGALAHPDFNGLGGGTALGMAKSQLNAQNKPEWAWVAYEGATGTTLASNGCTCDENGTPSGACFCDNPGARVSSTRPHLTSPERYAEWYTDVPGVNVTLPGLLNLPRNPSTGQYIFDSGAAPNLGYMDPFNTGGWVALGFETMSGCDPDRNVSWTSETHFWFEYAGGERFDFSGDDDTWVFVDGKLVVDLGGLHSPLQGWFQLDADDDDGGPDTADGTVSVTQDLIAGTNTIDLELTVGGVYEVAMFQAERNQCGSNFKVTLKDFNRPKSECLSECGDGVVASDEVCDDGAAENTGEYGKCGTDCLTRGPYCGDGTLDEDGDEQCDDGNRLNGDSCNVNCRKGSTTIVAR